MKSNDTEHTVAQGYVVCISGGNEAMGAVDPAGSLPCGTEILLHVKLI